MVTITQLTMVRNLKASSSFGKKCLNALGTKTKVIAVENSTIKRTEYLFIES